MLFVCIFYFFPGVLKEFLGRYMYVCTAGTLEPLAYTRASSSEFFLPYTRLNSPMPPIWE